MLSASLMDNGISMLISKFGKGSKAAWRDHCFASLLISPMIMFDEKL